MQRYLKCHPGEFECEISKSCLPRNFVNNGKSDCKTESNLDSSDENNTMIVCNENFEFPCDNICISREKVMDGTHDCKDKMDENTTLECHKNFEFRCRANGRCIPRYRVNDGFPDCIDSSDESRRGYECLKNKEFECESGRCIPIEWVGNSVDDCPSGSDERQTRVNCHVEGYFSCLDARRCLPLKYLCDGVQNCDDASDETDLCPDPLLFTCLGSQKSDPVPWSITFRHTESKKLVCRDGSHMKTEFLPGFKCRVELERSDLKRVLVPQFYLKNNVSVCADGSDSCDDENCITCLDGSTVISKAQVCDGQVDCADSSDECVCENVKATVTCNETFLGISSKGSLMNTTLCDENDVGCNDKMTKPKHNEDIKLDNSFYTCLDYDVINAKNDPKNFNKNAKFCDGVVECANKDDECSTRCRNEVFFKARQHNNRKMDGLVSFQRSLRNRVHRPHVLRRV